jgi:hypothetical protein
VHDNVIAHGGVRYIVEAHALVDAAEVDIGHDGPVGLGDAQDASRNG